MRKFQLWYGSGNPERRIAECELIRLPMQPDPVLASSNDRIRYASWEESIFFADHDVVLSPEFWDVMQWTPPRVPYFNFYKGLPDDSLFYAVGCRGFFVEMLEIRARRGWDATKRNWPRKILMDMTNRVGRIPDHLFTHLKEAPHGQAVIY